jgi:ribonuclease PH
MNSSAALRRTDLRTLCNLRNDGRMTHELRRMSIQMSPLSHSNHVSGSALVTMGLTMALAIVSGPMDCARKSDELPDR